jgi:hypothetical protein
MDGTAAGLRKKRTAVIGTGMVLHQIRQNETIYPADLNLPLDHIRKIFPGPHGEQIHVTGVQNNGITGVSAAGGAARTVRASHGHHILRAIKMSIIYFFYRFIADHSCGHVLLFTNKYGSDSEPGGGADAKPAQTLANNPLPVTAAGCSIGPNSCVLRRQDMSFDFNSLADRFVNV